MKEGVALFSIVVIALAGIIFWSEIRAMVGGTTKERKKSDRVEAVAASPEIAAVQPGTVKVLETMEMPSILKEISGIVYLGSGNFACIQDEAGKIYYYSASSGKIEKEVQFSGRGDFEGIARVMDFMYVIRSDGRLFQVDPEATNPLVKEFDTGLSAKDDVESLAYDEEMDRLLMVGKDETRSGKGKRHVHAFDPATGETTVVFSVNTKAEEGRGKKKKEMKFNPSGMDIHPESGELYIVDGPSAKIYRVSRSGQILKEFELDAKEVPQVEGISFGTEGEVFISTEGVKGPGAILKVELN